MDVAAQLPLLQVLQSSAQERCGERDEARRVHHRWCRLGLNSQLLCCPLQGPLLLRVEMEQVACLICGHKRAGMLHWDLLGWGVGAEGKDWAVMRLMHIARTRSARGCEIPIRSTLVLCTYVFPHALCRSNIKGVVICSNFCISSWVWFGVVRVTSVTNCVLSNQSMMRSVNRMRECNVAAGDNTGRLLSACSGVFQSA